MQHKQSIYCSASSLYMFRVSTTPIIRSTQNCNYSWDPKHVEWTCRKINRLFCVASRWCRWCHWNNPSGRTMTLGLIQTEMSTRNIFPGGEGGRGEAAGAYGWQTYHLHMPTVLKSRSLTLLELSGSAHACNGIALLSYSCIQISAFLWQFHHSLRATTWDEGGYSWTGCWERCLAQDRDKQRAGLSMVMDLGVA